MKLGLRVFLGYFFAIGLAAWLGLSWIERELRPLVRQASEEALVEAAYALAAAVQPAMAATGLPDVAQLESMSRRAQLKINANIWGVHKEKLNLPIYITDKNGIVLYDSAGQNVGKDYSQWNDVYLTLRGQYGVRSTRSDPQDDGTAAMHVAAPIMKDDEVIGVLTVAMPSQSTQTYLVQAKNHLQWYGLAVVAASLLVGALFTGWLIMSLRRIGNYAEHAAEGRSALPQFAKGTELEKLTAAIDHMRDELEGKNYLENYIHHLTHELKSPLSAIKASNELLADGSMPADQRERFVATVDKQCTRLQVLADNLLQLIRLEKKRHLDKTQSLSINDLIRQEVQAMHAKAELRRVAIVIEIHDAIALMADPLLLALAVRNLLENALQFADENSSVRIGAAVREPWCEITVFNQGPAIPDYALPRLGERFYALPHPDGTKGTGLGLAFVREIAALHGGSFTIFNEADGVCSRLVLPA